MARDAGTRGPATWGPATWGDEGGTPAPAEGPAGGITPGQLRAERLARSHALAHLADEVEATARAAGACRADGSWSGPAHDAFVAALDDLEARVVRAAAGIRAAAGA